MFASDYRRQAREALKGRWIRTTLLLILAMVLGAGGSVYGASGSIGSTKVKLPAGEPMNKAAVIALIVLAVIGLWKFFMGSYVNLGLVGMYKRTMEGETPRAGMFFPAGLYWKSLGLSFMIALFVFLWSLLLIVPGIIASYRYSMAQYLLYTHPEMGVMEVLRESKRCMTGRKERLFCLNISFIGWRLLSVLPSYLLVMASSFTWTFSLNRNGAAAYAMPAYYIVSMVIGVLVTAVASAFLGSYENMAVIAFFRDAERAEDWRAEARSGEDYAEQNYGEAENAADGYAAAENFARNVTEEDLTHFSLRGEHPAATTTVLSADETVAKDMFQDYQCSRRKMEEAGVLEDYKALNVSQISEMRWVRAYGDELMRRFDQDSTALEDILNLISEYAMMGLADRALQRVERHIRQQTLPDVQILNMVGNFLATIGSGVFAEDESFVRRKQEQALDMVDRLQQRLEESDPDGAWKKGMELIRTMCE